MGVSVLTLARDRRRHLQRLIEGLCRSDRLPDELLIVDMGGAPIELPRTAFPVRILSLAEHGLPLARARNLAASEACHEVLLFLDVDCIPMASLVGAMCRAVDNCDALICAEIRYLNEAVDEHWQEDALRQKSVTHEVRSFPLAGMRVEGNPGLFWSLAFAVRASLFRKLGGFDTAFNGYGGEDTDFGFRANAAGVELMFLGGTGAFHQIHASYDPPLQHFEDIIRNAAIFYETWRVWPMEGWLAAFERMGLIRVGEDDIVLVRRPRADEVESARQFAHR